MFLAKCNYNQKINLTFLASACQSRWQRLRQYYAKERQKQKLEKRSGSKAVNRMPWYLFSSMSFLDSHMYKRKCVRL